MVIMKKTILLTMTTLTLFSMSPNSAQAYTNDSKTLEEAKKAHPNAQFKVNKDTGAYTQKQRAKQQSSKSVTYKRQSSTRKST